MLRPDDTVLDAFRVLQERTIQKDRTSILMRHTDFGIEWSICCVGYFVGSLIYPSINRSCRRTSRTMAEFASPSRMNDWSSMQWIHDLSKKRSFVHFVWKSDPEKHLGLDVPFQCTPEDLLDEAKKALKALSDELASATVAMPS